jgi:hypothetical protein
MATNNKATASAEATASQAAAADAPFDPTLFKKVARNVADLVVLNPQTNAPTTWIWHFAGPSHPLTVARNDRLAQEALEEANKIRRTRGNGKKYKPENMKPDQARREAIDEILDVCLGWSGATIEYSREEAMKMLLDPGYTFLLRQINDFLEDEAAFIETSATS